MKLARPPIPPSKNLSVCARARREEGVGGMPQYQSKARCGVKIHATPELKSASRRKCGAGQFCSLRRPSGFGGQAK